MLSIKWRNLIHNVCDAEASNEGQFALPNKQYLEAVFIEELQNEINRMARRSQIKFANDAKSCYDRMMPGLANLISRKYGMPKTMCMVQGKTLEEAKHSL